MTSVAIFVCLPDSAEFLSPLSSDTAKVRDAPHQLCNVTALYFLDHCYGRVIVLGDADRSSNDGHDSSTVRHQPKVVYAGTVSS